MLPLCKMLDVQTLIQDKVSYNSANVFGVIVYTEENPHIIKVLRDSDYWDSFNARTKNWLLYAIRPDDNHKHLAEEYLLPEMGIKTKKDLPLLIVFAIGPNQDLLQRAYTINDSSVDAAYQSIEGTVNTITDAVKMISPRYISSTHVYREVTKALDAELAKRQWKKVTSEMGKFIATIFQLR